MMRLWSPVSYTHLSLPADGAMISTIVTTNMAAAIAKYYGVRFIEVLTGFKYIGQQILGFETKGEGCLLYTSRCV